MALLSSLTLVFAPRQADDGDDSNDSDGEGSGHREHSHHSRWRDLLPGLLTHRRLHRGAESVVDDSIVTGSWDATVNTIAASITPSHLTLCL